VDTSHLVSLLDSAGIDQRDYRILRDWPDDGLHLVRDGDQWEIHFHERGERFDIQTFDSEDAACVEFLRRMLEFHRLAGELRARPNDSASDYA
jgi:hypothetical protein